MTTPQDSNKLSAAEAEALLEVLRNRFESNMHRHPDVSWEKVRARLEAKPASLLSLSQMESTGGEPDIIAITPNSKVYYFFDCSPERPKGRRSLCYDDPALESRKQNKPAGSALGVAASMGIELLSEEQYQDLQALGEFDLKTSSWLATPTAVRKLGGAIFGDRRFGRVFVYHNGAESYYAARGFRGVLTV